MAEVANSGGVQKRRSASDWREIFERRAASGLSIAVFCQREGIAKSSYERWRTQLFAEARDTGAVVARAEMGFMDAGTLGRCAKAGTDERIDVRLELGHGIVLHVVRG